MATTWQYSVMKDVLISLMLQRGSITVYPEDETTFTIWSEEILYIKHTCNHLIMIDHLTTEEKRSLGYILLKSSSFSAWYGNGRLPADQRET